MASKESPPRWAITSWSLHEQSGAEGEGLSAHKIVQGAIEIADAHGLKKLTFRRLGEHLGFGTMATYRHISSKEELILLMVDAALGCPSAAMRDASSWQSGLRLWAQAMSSRYQVHPWLIDAPMNAIPMTPNRILWLEYVLQILDKTGLALQQLLDIALLLDGHIRSVVRNANQLAKMMESDESPPSPTWLYGMLDEHTFPMTHQVLGAGALEDNTEQDLGFGLERIISGVEVLADTSDS